VRGRQKEAEGPKGIRAQIATLDAQAAEAKEQDEIRL